MGHSGRRCLRCDRGFLRCQKESLVSSRAPALFAGERDLSERFLGPTENVGPRNDNCTVPECGLPCPGRTGQDALSKIPASKEAGYRGGVFPLAVLCFYLSGKVKKRAPQPPPKGNHATRAPRRRARAKPTH